MTGKLFHNPARLSGTVFLLLTLAFAVQLEPDGLMRQLIPATCLAVMLLAAVIEFAAARRASATLVWSGETLRGLAVFGLYLGLIRLVGFLIATPLFTAAVFWLMASDRARGVLTGLGFGAVLAGAVYGLFVVGMGNLLPMGVFFDG